MENFEDYGKKPYEIANERKYSVSEQLNFAFQNFCTVLQIIFVTVYEVFKTIWSSKQPKDISGQLALVTGGANGFGRELAFRLAEEKCNVVICDVNYEEARKTATDIAKRFNVKTKNFKVDVSDASAVQQLRKDIENTLGSVDILVNNAGILSKISLMEGSPRDIQKVIDVNLTSHFWTIRAFLPSMIERKRGHIISVASLSAKFTFPLACAYISTKFGVRGLMSALYDELCIDNSDKYVKITTAYPHFMNTRKELSDVMDSVNITTPIMSSKFVADEVIKAMLCDKSEITLPSAIGLLQFINYLPLRVIKFAKQKLAPVGKLVEERKRAALLQQAN